MFPHTRYNANTTMSYWVILPPEIKDMIEEYCYEYDGVGKVKYWSYKVGVR